ncbi:unnamed protein product [Allacma fusca]|uniref:Uncharacterized protein n=1 Tax=Allacma fusca TaxID=39272 RepID=A0A8J2LK22_9HEXA|nr:unnamed protein product [Allacma fusca]
MFPSHQGKGESIKSCDQWIRCSGTRRMSCLRNLGRLKLVICTLGIITMIIILTCVGFLLLGKTSSNVLPTPTSQDLNSSWIIQASSTDSETALSRGTDDSVITEKEITTTLVYETESLYPGLNNSSPTTVLQTVQESSSTLSTVKVSTIKPPRKKCSIGTFSYEEFKFDSIPAKTTQCSIKAETFANPVTKRGDLVRRILCEDTCSYYSARVTNFQFHTGLKGLVGKARTAVVHPRGRCPEKDLPSKALGTLWGKLNWLQIEFQVQNECNPVYEMVSSWKMPKLQLLSFDRPYFSVSNQDSVRAILKKNSKIKSLRINQGVSCVHCDVFSGIRLPKLTKADIRWKQEFAHVLNQTKTLVSMAPGLTDFTLSLDLPVPEFIWMSKQLKHLKNAQFGIFLNKSEGHQYHLSLSTTIGFEKIENLTLRISVEHAEPNTIPLTIMDFQYLNPSLKCLTVMTKGPYAMNIASDSRRFCTRTHKILQKGQLLKCCRK